MLVFVPLVSALLGAASVGSVKSGPEVEFGIDVAEKGLWHEARFRFEKAILINPKDAAALNDLAVALEQEGEFAKAREAYEKALKLRPGDTYIQQNFDLFREADDKRNRKSKKKP